MTTVTVADVYVTEDTRLREVRFVEDEEGVWVVTQTYSPDEGGVSYMEFNCLTTNGGGGGWGCHG